MKTVIIALALAGATTSVCGASPLGTPYDAFLNLTVTPPNSTLRVEVHESQPPNSLFFTFDGIPELFPFTVPSPEATPGKDLLVNESLTQLRDTNTELLTFEFTAADGGTLHLNPIPAGISGAFGIVDLFWDGATQPPIIDQYEVEVFQGATSSILATTPSIVLGSGLPSDPLEVYYFPPFEMPNGITRLEFRMQVSHVPEPTVAVWLLGVMLVGLAGRGAEMTLS